MPSPTNIKLNPMCACGHPAAAHDDWPKCAECACTEWKEPPKDDCCWAGDGCCGNEHIADDWRHHADVILDGEG